MIEGKASLWEVQTWYSLEDVANVNAALDASLEARRKADEAVSSGANVGRR